VQLTESQYITLVEGMKQLPDKPVPTNREKLFLTGKLQISFDGIFP
jgi:hypothetical protein